MNSSIPPKPWQRSSLSNQQTTVGSMYQNNSISNSLSSSTLTPRPPPRNYASYSRYSRPGLYGNTMIGSGMNSYGSYGSPYSSYGGGYGLNSFGSGLYGSYQNSIYGEDPLSQSSLSWIRDLQAIVMAVGRVSSLIDANVHTLYISFTSFLSVIEKMSHMRKELSHAFRAVSVIMLLGSMGTSIHKIFKILMSRKHQKTHSFGSHSGLQNMDVYEFNTFDKSGFSTSNSSLLLWSSVLLLSPFIFIIVWAYLNKREKQLSTKNSYELFRALYDFPGENEGDLRFMKGDIISIISKPSSDWWEGELNGQIGLVPVNFIESFNNQNPLLQTHLVVQQNTSNYQTPSQTQQHRLLLQQSQQHQQQQQQQQQNQQHQHQQQNQQHLGRQQHLFHSSSSPQLQRTLNYIQPQQQLHPQPQPQSQSQPQPQSQSQPQPPQTQKHQINSHPSSSSSSSTALIPSNSSPSLKTTLTTSNNNNNQ